MAFNANCRIESTSIEEKHTRITRQLSGGGARVATITAATANKLYTNLQPITQYREFHDGYESKMTKRQEQTRAQLRVWQRDNEWGLTQSQHVDQRRGINSINKQKDANSNSIRSSIELFVFNAKSSPSPSFPLLRCVTLFSFSFVAFAAAAAAALFGPCRSFTVTRSVWGFISFPLRQSRLCALLASFLSLSSS